jgi:hypothetical protein
MIIIEYTKENIAEYDHEIKDNILTLTERKDYSDVINPAAVNPNIK